MSAKKPTRKIEKILEDHSAIPSLQALVDAGCDRAELLFALEWAFLSDESWETLAGMNLRDFKSALRQIRDCAELVDRLNRSELLYRLSIEQRDPSFVSLRELPTISDRLREYAHLLENRSKFFGPRRKITAHTWKAMIVAQVIEDTTKPHDFEVSTLIAAVLDNLKYSEKAHQAWRLKHTDIIEMMIEKIREHRLGRHGIVPPPRL